MELYALKEFSTSDIDLQEVELYHLEQIIHKGKGCTRLLKAYSTDPEELLVVKLFPKAKNGQSCVGFMTEEKSLSQLSHPYLLKYHAFYKDALIKGRNDEFSRYSAIVMEHIRSGDLFHLVSRGSLSEKLARTLFKQMISVIEYLHARRLAHLDIKLENFLIASNGIRLIDFEGCQNIQNKCPSENLKGTAGYRAPELLNGTCQDLRAADIYSLGIVLFTMVMGTPPYTETYENGTYKFDQYYEALREDTAKFWKVHDHYRAADHKEPLSKEFKQLVAGMIAEKPEDRLKLEDIKCTKWSEGKMFSKEELKRNLLNCFEDNL